MAVRAVDGIVQFPAGSDPPGGSALVGAYRCLFPMGKTAGESSDPGRSFLGLDRRSGMFDTAGPLCYPQPQDFWFHIPYDFLRQTGGIPVDDREPRLAGPVWHLASGRLGRPSDFAGSRLPL